AGGCGTGFRLTPPKRAGGTWTETILHRFGHAGDGFFPSSAPLPGDNGVLCGATEAGGDPKCGTRPFNTCGTVYELKPPRSSGGGWTKKVICTFTNAADGYPEGDLTPYRGVIYGTTYGGPAGCGTVCGLAPPARPSGKWSYRTLYSFSCSAPNAPLGGLIVGSGAVCGTSSFSPHGAGQGSVFALTQLARSGSMWNIDTVLRFDGKNGSAPEGDLVAGKGGVLFGATGGGGNGPCANSIFGRGCGTVWQLAPPAKAGGAWTQTVLYNFQKGRDGSLPIGISAGGPNLLFGTTQAAGDSKCFAPSGCGTVFKLVP
ncbi:MAG: hypothetical protein ACREJM_13635, partial [Candidatus Saccharimonadales bacterium]